jgi:predicted dehydrogenase
MTWTSATVALPGLLGGLLAISPWRAERGALVDVGSHVIDLVSTALGPVAEVLWAYRGDADLRQFGLRHTSGAQSTLTMSLSVPIDTTAMEISVSGGGRLVGSD